MHKGIFLVILAVAVVSVFSYALVPASLSSTCHPTSSVVPSSEAPEKDVNQNGIICKTVRDGPPTVTVYLDD